MLRLFFISAATQFKTARELNEILRTARMNNRAQGVTSLLIYNDGSFAQLMEGPKQAVLEAYDRIKSDNRHSGASIIFQEETEERITEGWDMALIPASKVASDDDYDFMTPAMFQASPQYEAAMKHSMLRAFLHSFKAAAKTPVKPKKTEKDALISPTARRFLKIYGSSRRFARYMPIPVFRKPDNDLHPPKRSDAPSGCGSA